MAVLTRLVFLAADLVATDMDPMSWADFVHQLPLPKTHSTTERPETPQPTSQLSADLLAKFPWLAQTGVQPSTSDGGGAAASSTSSASTAPAAPSLREDTATTDDARMDSVWSELYARREEMRVAAPCESAAFRVSLLGGAWAQSHLGVVYDAYQGKAHTRDSEQWCHTFSLNQSSRHSVAVCGDRAAAALARAWCHRMDFWHSMWVASSASSFEYSTEALAEYEEPEWVGAALLGASTRALGRLAELRALRPVRAAASSSGA